MSKYKFESSSGFVEFYEEETKTNHILSGKAVVDKLNYLEAKLAESEKEREFLKEENKINKKDADYYFDELNLYKHKLAEKDKEIEKLNKRIEKQVDNGYKIIQNCKELQIEQLEKVKELLFASAKEITGTSVASVRLWSVNEIFDNQIEELKKGDKNG